MTANAILLNKQTVGNVVSARRFSIYSVETVRGGIEMIDALATEWTALCEEGASNEPFFRPEWFRAFVKNFENEILLVVVRRAGKLRAILPLVEKREMLHGIPVRKLAAIFNLQSQRYDLIHPADEAEKTLILESLLIELKRLSRWSVFETRLTYKNSWLNDLLTLAEKEGFKTGIWEMDSAPFVTLPQGDDKTVLIENYFKGLSKNRRKLLSKNLRHLQELGKVEFVVTQGISRELLDKYFALEAKSWKGRAGTDASSAENIKRLHEDFACYCAARKTLFVHELKLNGQTIAMYLSIQFAPERTIGWKMSFDEEYARFSPGNVLFKEVLSDCMRRGSTELDMLSPSNYNKMLFASGVREHAALYIFRKGFIGKTLHFWKFGVVRSLREKFRKQQQES